MPPEAGQDEGLVWYLGGPLRHLDHDFRESLAACRALDGLDLDLGVALRLWERALHATDAAAPVSSWYHGDLLAENLLVADGRLFAVLDVGGLAVGDPAVDLVCAWEVLDGTSRESFRRAVGADDATWLAGAAWALLIAVSTFPYYWHPMPARCASRRAIAANVIAGL